MSYSPVKGISTHGPSISFPLHQAKLTIVFRDGMQQILKVCLKNVYPSLMHSVINT